MYLLDVLISHYWSEYPPITAVNNFISTSMNGFNTSKLVFTPVRLCYVLILFNTKYCKVQPHRALLGYPFCNTAAHMKAMPTREGI